MLKTLTATRKELQQLRSDLGSGVHVALDLPANAYVDFRAMQVPGGKETTYQLSCERYGTYAVDNRGAQLPVIEIFSGRAWQVFVGLSLTWSQDGREIHRFVGTQLIMFLNGTDAQDPASARQVMRLEWEALDINDNLAGEIAHPHWQIDLEGFAIVAREETRSSFASLGGGEPLDTPIMDTFSTQRSADLTWSSKLHLAAAARWMDRAWNDERPVPHVAGPQDLAELTAWVVSSCRYLVRQVEGAFEP